MRKFCIVERLGERPGPAPLPLLPPAEALVSVGGVPTMEEIPLISASIVAADIIDVPLSSLLLLLSSPLSWFPLVSPSPFISPPHPRCRRAFFRASALPRV